LYVGLYLDTREKEPNIRGRKRGEKSKVGSEKFKNSCRQKVSSWTFFGFCNSLTYYVNLNIFHFLFQMKFRKFETKEKTLEKLRESLKKLEIQVTDKDENKDIALGTSKLNYLDPRISVAWCKKYQVPIEKIYSKTQREKFRWAIDMATAEYHFYNYEGEIQLRDMADLDELEGGGNTTQDTQDDTQDGDEEEEDEDDD
jgi:hypothetical protein